MEKEEWFSKMVMFMMAVSVVVNFVVSGHITVSIAMGIFREYSIRIKQLVSKLEEMDIHNS